MRKDSVGIEANECYIGSEPRKTHKHTDEEQNKRGRGNKNKQS